MMQPKEVKSLIQQLLYCYGANRRAQQPVRLCFSGFSAISSCFPSNGNPPFNQPGRNLSAQV